MPNITPLRKTIASHLGQILTPEIAAEIELAVAILPDERPDLAAFGCINSGEFTIQAERLGDILDEMHALHGAHWLETEGHRHGIAMDPDYPAMLADEFAGRLIQFTVRLGGRLCGGLRMYVYQSRHTKTLAAKEDTLYLCPDVRGGMTAIKLMRFAEKCLLSIGVREIEADSKLVNNADTLMRRMKYQEVATKFVKVFKENSHV